MRRPFQVRALGEIAVRCGDLDRMTAFYRDVVGLTVLEEFRADGIVFFEIAPGHRGHTTVLALFRNDAGRPELHDRSPASPATGATSSLHHLALSVDADQQDAIVAWMADHGVETRVQVFGWIGWRGVFIRDPEGNTVEFVAADSRFREPTAS